LIDRRESRRYRHATARGRSFRDHRLAPVAKILEQMAPDGSWTTLSRDYQKYGGNLWQIHFLGELHADGDDERVQTAGSIPCLTANDSSSRIPRYTTDPSPGGYDLATHSATTPMHSKLSGLWRCTQNRPGRSMPKR